MAGKVRKEKAIEIAWKASGKTAIRFTEGIFDEANPAFAETLRAASGSETPRIALVADGNFVYHNDGVGSAIGRYLQAHGITLAAKPIVIGGGEKLKSDNLQTFLSVAGAVLDAKLGADDVVVALGGGTIFDVAGLAAATVRGGVRFVRIPTTPAAMLDGVFATNAALDSTHVKDAIRVTVRADAALVDPGLAKSVLDGVWKGGLAEAVRYAAAADAALFKKLAAAADALAKRDPAVTAEIIRAVVEKRAKKDLGDFALWSAHVLEPMSSYKLPHGYAVAIGVALEAAYAAAKGYAKPEEAESVISLLKGMGALDGVFHSRHLVANVDQLKRGEDEWRLGAGRSPRTVLAGIGETATEEKLDVEALGRAVKDFLK